MNNSLLRKHEVKAVCHAKKRSLWSGLLLRCAALQQGQMFISIYNLMIEATKGGVVSFYLLQEVLYLSLISLLFCDSAEIRKC